MMLRAAATAKVKAVVREAKSGQVKGTLDDRALLAQFSAEAIDSDAMKVMRVD